MAFKMKGSAFKLNEVATKSTMKMAKKAMKMKEESAMDMKEKSPMELKTSYKMKEAMAKMKDKSAMKAKDDDAVGPKGSATIPSHIREVYPKLTNEAYNKNKSMYDKAAQAKINKEKSAMKQAKPDYPDIDGDGNTTESMKKAAADKKSPMEQGTKPLDKLKAFGTAMTSEDGLMTSGLGAVYQAKDRYDREKKKYRKAAADKKKGSK